MITANKIKWIRSLSQKKFRKESGLFIAEGDKIVRELGLSNLQIHEVFALEGWVEKNQLPDNIPVTVVSPRELERISLLSSPNQALALVKTPHHKPSSVSTKDNHILFLDDIQDPGNLGTIIRTADWFGIKDIICSQGTAELYNPKVIQATMGSFSRINIYYTDLVPFLESLKGKAPILGAMLNGEDLHTATLKENVVLVVGNESRGISETIVPHLTQRIFIPRGGKSSAGTDSLNAAVATGIILSYLCNSRR